MNDLKNFTQKQITENPSKKKELKEKFKAIMKEIEGKAKMYNNLVNTFK